MRKLNAAQDVAMGVDRVPIGCADTIGMITVNNKEAMDGVKEVKACRMQLEQRVRAVCKSLSCLAGSFIFDNILDYVGSIDSMSLGSRIPRKIDNCGRRVGLPLISRLRKTHVITTTKRKLNSLTLRMKISYQC